VGRNEGEVVSKAVIKKAARRLRRIYPPGTGAADSDWFSRVQRAMVEAERTGLVRDPALRKRIREGWHPAVEIALMTLRPDFSPMFEFGALKILNDRLQRDAELREKSRESSDVKVTVIVPGWARAPGLEPALPAPQGNNGKKDDVFDL
jgi:hypothetical protein